MGKRTRKQDELAFEQFGELIFLCGAFLLGAVLGSFFASGFSEEGLFFRLLFNGIRLRTFLLIHGSLIALIFLSAFFRFGYLMAPFAIAVEGFILSASVTCYIAQYGAAGYWPALVGIGFSNAALIALQLLLGCRAAEYAEHGLRRPDRSSYIHSTRDRGYWLSGALALFLVMLIGWIHCHWLARFAGFLLARIA